MNGCPKNKTTGRPVVYGSDSCKVFKRTFVKWGDRGFELDERHECEYCGTQFIYPKEAVQIPAKTG